MYEFITLSVIAYTLLVIALFWIALAISETFRSKIQYQLLEIALSFKPLQVLFPIHAKFVFLRFNGEHIRLTAKVSRYVKIRRRLISDAGDTTEAVFNRSVHIIDWDQKKLKVNEEWEIAEFHPVTTSIEKRGFLAHIIVSVMCQDLWDEIHAAAYKNHQKFSKKHTSRKTKAKLAKNPELQYQKDESPIDHAIRVANNLGIARADSAVEAEVDDQMLIAMRFSWYSDKFDEQRLNEIKSSLPKPPLHHIWQCKEEHHQGSWTTWLWELK